MSDKAMKKFDFYEFAGVLCPGALLLFALVRIVPELSFLGRKENLSFGDLGVLVLLSYVAGQLVQAVGNVIANVWWKLWSGLPSDWIRSGQRPLLALHQTAQLPQKVVQLTQLQIPNVLSQLTSADWYMVTRQIYATVRHAGRAERIDIFNAYYGMFRGLAASFLMIVVAYAVQRGFDHFQLYVLLAGAFVLAMYRMHRFAVNYARELFVQFLATQKTDKAPAFTGKEAE